MPSKQKTPSKTDLIKAIDSLMRYEPAKLRALDKKRREADSAVDEFLKNSPLYKRLTNSRSKADSKYYSASHEYKKELSARLTNARNEIYTKGVTPATQEMVAKLLKDLS